MKRKSGKVIYTLLILICGAVFAFSLYKVCTILLEYHAGTSTYDELRQYVSAENKIPTDPDPEDTAAVSTDSEKAESEMNFPPVDFDSLEAINADCVGWIYCEDTTINYPIVQGEDNSYYLDHLFNGVYNSAGSIFLDYRNSSDFSDFHSVIYGHQMKNDSMFNAITKYEDQTFFDSHPTMLLMTQAANYEMLIFSGYVASAEDNAWQISFSDDAAKADWLNSICESSCFESGIMPDTSDRIVTLSTCSNKFENARFVLFGILREH